MPGANWSLRLASVVTFWCETSQCEVPTGIWVDTEGLRRLARQGGSIRCEACGQQHPLEHAYLKPHSNPITLATHHRAAAPKGGPGR